jgi:ribosomal protein S18 acetylase RimI-like enzyme
VIRRLEQADLPAFRELRLQALQAHPEAFGVTFEEEQAADIARLLSPAPGIALGGFDGERLTGSAVMTVPDRIKQRHKGHIVAVYVAPDQRGRGLGKALIAALIAHAKAVGLRQVTLSVTVSNDAAHALYRAAGFTTYGVEPGSLYVDGRYLDVELMVLRLGDGAGDAR